MPRKTTVVLGGLLAVSVLGNAWQGLTAAGKGIGEYYVTMFREREIAALRSFGVRVAAGEAPRAVFLDLGGPVTEEHGWLNNSTLRAKFDGERLVKLCGSTSPQPDPCLEEAK